MFLRIFVTIWKWVSALFVFDPVKQATDDLEEIAKQEIEKKFVKLRSRRDEVDAQTFESFDYIPESMDYMVGFGFGKPQTIRREHLTLQGPKAIPESIDSFIKFHRNKIIQTSPELIFVGTFLEQKRVAVKMIGSDDLQLDQEMEIADQLKHHESFLPHFFGFNQMGVNFIAMDYYQKTLDCFDKVPLCLHKLDIRNIFGQLCNAIDFLHDSGIAHRCLNKQNIAVVVRGKEPVFKITNFRDAVRTIREEAFNQDVEALGFILLDLLSKNRPQRICDEKLGLNLVDKMTYNDDLKKRMTIKQVKAHPFLWSSHETLHFIVQLTKMLEKKDNQVFEMSLKGVSGKIFPDDWRGYVEPFVIDELKSINFGKLPLGNIFGLVKTIRNLTVHHRNDKIAKAMGRREDELLEYWTERFPQLVLQLSQLEHLIIY